jgi:hypothetical protein
MLALGQINQPDCCEKVAGSDETVRGNLTRTKERLEKQLAKVNAGLEVLDKQPEFSKSIETLLTAMRA